MNILKKYSNIVIIFLLTCGLLASLLYLGSDIAAAMRWKGYSITAQSVSELRAIGSPTRAFLMPILSVYAVLEILFGLGIWRIAGKKRALRVTSILLVALGILDSMGPLFALNINEAIGSVTNIIHIAVTALTVLLIFLIIGFGASADKKWFRFYSIGTILTLIVTGVASFIDVQKFAAQQQTPWIGVIERINIYGYMLWVIVLTTVLLRSYRSKIYVKTG
jgi:hypothetical protein